MTDFLFEGSKITVDGDCSPEVKRGSLLGKRAMINLGSAFKNRDITLLTKVCLVKAMVLPEVMYGCECWTIKKVEHWWTDAFQLWCWRTLESPLDSKEIKPVYSKGLMLKLQYFGHLMQRADSLEKTLMLGKIEDKSWRGRQRMIWLDSITDSVDYPGDTEGQGGLTCCSPWGRQESEIRDWTPPSQ